MGKNIKSTRSAPHPHLWRWVTQPGRVEIGYCHQTRSFIRLMDEGGMVWHGRRSYRSLDAALADADAGAARWMKEELGITDVA
jgi:hypothetical protein